MFRSVFLLIASVLAFAIAEEVVTLTDSNFDETIKNNQFVLVEFYAPWCGHCKKLAPEYENAAVALKDFDPKVVIAKVDATAETTLASKFGIKGFPTLKWFVDGSDSEYNGGRTESTIVSWIKKKVGPATTPLKTVEDLEKFQNSAEAVAIGLFKDEAEGASFVKQAMVDESTPFGACFGDCAALIAKAGLKDSTKIAVLQKFEEGKVEFDGDISSISEIKTFVDSNSLPSIIDFFQKTAPKIFGGAVKNQLLIFVDEHKSESTKKIKSDLKEVAKKLKSKLTFVCVQKEDKRVAEFFGVKEGDIPTVRIVNMDGGAKKYKFEGEINAQNIEKFADDYFAGNVKMDLKSAKPLPESEQKDVRVVAGTEFEDLIGQDKDVFMEFYAPWCGHCKKLEPEYDAVGAHFKDNEKIVVAKMDATENEVERVQVSGFPTLKFFPAGSKTPVDYEGSRDKDGIIDFIKKNAKSLQ